MALEQETEAKENLYSLRHTSSWFLGSIENYFDFLGYHEA